ncbi:hypothetical protein [Humibacter ginsengiterrae]
MPKNTMGSSANNATPETESVDPVVHLKADRRDRHLAADAGDRASQSASGECRAEAQRAQVDEE